jgi:folylpolyglutamate synthase/dihydropteroate synthase
VAGVEFLDDSRGAHPQAGIIEARISVVEDVPASLCYALKEARPEDLVCVTGSLFVVAEARAAWLETQGVDFERDPAL